MASLYQHKRVKGLISLTHGEGFGLPLLEAAACGLPILATNWSAHKEFLNLGHWEKIDCNILEIPQRKIDGTIWIKGSKWAYPDVQATKVALKQFVNDSEQLIETVLPLKNKIRNTYSFKKISYRYDKFFKRWI